MINFFRPYIIDLSSRTAWLNDKLSFKNNFKWTDEEQKMFDSIFQDIANQTQPQISRL